MHVDDWIVSLPPDQRKVYLKLYAEALDPARGRQYERGEVHIHEYDLTPEIEALVEARYLRPQYRYLQTGLPVRVYEVQLPPK